MILSNDCNFVIFFRFSWLFRRTLVRQSNFSTKQSTSMTSLIFVYFNSGKFSGFDPTEPTSESHGKANVLRTLKHRFHYARY